MYLFFCTNYHFKDYNERGVLFEIMKNWDKIHSKDEFD